MRRVEALNGLASRMTSASQQAADVERMLQHTTGSGRYASNLEAQVRTIPESGPAALLLAPLPPASALLPTAEDRSDGVVLALGTTYDDVMAHLRAGEATSVVLLTATALGLASCPASEPLAAIAARKVFRENVFNAEGFPQMLLRIGWAPVNADPLPATPRRELTDVVEWLGDDGGAS
jgi:nitroreductase